MRELHYDDNGEIALIQRQDLIYRAACIIDKVEHNEIKLTDINSELLDKICFDLQHEHPKLGCIERDLNRLESMEGVNEKLSL